MNSLYTHICVKEKCNTCHQFSCDCERYRVITNSGYEIHCPHCNAVTDTIVITISTTSCSHSYYQTST